MAFGKYDSRHFFPLDVTIESSTFWKIKEMSKMDLISEKIMKRESSVRHLHFLHRIELEKKGHYLANKGKRNFLSEVDNKMRK